MPTSDHSGGSSSLPPGGALAIASADLSERAGAGSASTWLHSVFRLSPEPIFLSDFQGRILDANPAAQALLGYDSSALLCLGLADLIDDTSLAGVQSALASLPSQGVSPVIDVRIRTAAGALIDVECRGITVSHEAGGRILSFARDVTASRRQDAAIKRRDANFRLVTHNVRDIIWKMNTSLEFTFVTPSVTSVLGYARTGAITLAQILAPESYATALEWIHRAFADPPTHGKGTIELRHRCADGTIKPCEVTFTVLCEVSGEALGVLGVTRDISERKRLEEEAHAARDFLRRIINTVADPVFVKDEDHRWIEFNTAFCEFVGRSREELIGRNDFDFFPWHEAKHFWDRDRAVFASGKTDETEETLTTASGETRVILTKKAVLSADANHKVLVGVIRDVTARKKAEAELRRINESLEKRVLERTQELREANERLQIDIRARQTAETELTRQSALLEGITQAAKSLLTHPSFSQSIGLALEILGRAANVDRTYIFENHPHVPTGEPAFSQRYEWVREGTTRFLHDPSMQNATYASWSIGHWRETLARGEPIAGVIREMPGIPVEMFEAQDIKSLILVPIFTTGDYFWGFLGFDDCHTERRWNQSERAAMINTAAAIGGAIRRDQTLRELRTSEELYRRLVSSLVEGVILVTPQGIVAASNTAAQNIVGMPQSQLDGFDLNHPLYQVFDEDGRPIAPENYPSTEALRTKAPVRNRVVGFRKLDGSETWVSSSAQPLFREGESEPFAVVNSFADITESRRADAERRRLESQLHQARRLEAIGTLASGVAHEINNPLMGIMNYAQLIRNRMEPGHPLQTYANEIIHESERVAAIVRSLLGFARREPERKSAALVSDIIESTLSLVRTLVAKDQIRLEVSVPTDLPFIRCHAQQIQQVIMNLVTNARDALNERYPGYHDDKIIRIGAGAINQDGARWVRLAVEDHGCGIAPEIAAKIFDPFVTTKHGRQGTGLGLSICHGIITEHGGRLGVESEPGAFTRFCVDLPAEGGG